MVQPCKVYVQNTTHTIAVFSAGKDTPQASTLHSRPKEPKTDCTPAPGTYSPEKCDKALHDKAPKYTFGVKTQTSTKNATPGK